MQKRPIGKTGLEVTPLSFGTSALGDMPQTYGYAVEEERALATIRAIFDGPVNMLDTSRLYGFGRSEERVGRVIRERGGLPEGFVLSTKLDRELESRRFDGDRARQSFDQSLTALGLDRVQILHLHDPEYAVDLTEVTRKGGAIDTLFRLRDEGLAQAVGLAMGRIDLMWTLLRDWPFDVIISHNRMTLINRQAEELFDWCAEKGIAILNAAPFAGGVLAKGSAEMPRISYSEADDAALAPVRAIEALCAQTGVAPGAAALQFSLRDPRIASTIVGVSKPERIEQALGWAGAEIPDSFWAEVAEVPISVDDPEAKRVYRPG